MRWAERGRDLPGRHEWPAWGAAGVALAIMAVSLGVLTGAASAPKAEMAEPTVLAVCPVARSPVIDGRQEALWDAANPAVIALMRGRQGTESAFAITLRAVHTTETVYFLASWPDLTAPAAAAAEGGERNKLILHFEIPAPWPGAADLMCLAACHTAYVDGTGRGRYVIAETIPPGQTATLPVGGGWQDGRWTFEWARPLVSGNPFDVQFSDLDTQFHFFVKVVEGLADRADPISADCVLRFVTIP